MSNPNPEPNKVFIGCNGEAEKQLLDYVHSHCDFGIGNFPRSSLDNRVHPIFQPSRWIDPEFTENLYEEIKPALQLASLFLTDERMNSWWVDFESSQPCSLPGGREYLATNTNLSQVEKRKAWAIKLEQLSTVMTWTFGDLLDDKIDARTSPFAEERDDFLQYVDRIDSSNREELAKSYIYDRGEILQSAKHNLYRLNNNRYTSTGVGFTSPSVMLARQYLTHLRLASTVGPVSPSFLFVLAIILCHELAHCVWYYPRPKCEFPDEFVPIRWNRNLAASLFPASLPGNVPEVGKEWENSMFGEFLDFVSISSAAEKMRPEQERYSLVGYSRSGPKGTAPIEYQKSLYILGQSHRRYETTLIPLHNISQLFQKTTWVQSTKDDILKSLTDTWTVYLELPPKDHPEAKKAGIARISVFQGALENKIMVNRENKSTVLNSRDTPSLPPAKYLGTSRDTFPWTIFAIVALAGAFVAGKHLR